MSTVAELYNMALQAKTRFGEESNEEYTIAGDAYYSYKYARYVLKSNFKLGEAVIADNAWVACDYARYVLKDGFKSGEPAISTDAEYSFLYARYALKRRFIEAEVTIFASDWASFYINAFIDEFTSEELLLLGIDY